MKNGYSLMEILIVITIILAVVGGSSVGYSRISLQRQLEQDVSAFADTANQARERTIARDIGQACLAFTGYSISVAPAAGNYDLSRRCALGFQIIQVYRPQRSVILGANRRFDFLHPYGTIAAQQIVTFRNVNLRRCMDVIIRTSGVVTTRPDAYTC